MRHLQVIALVTLLATNPLFADDQSDPWAPDARAADWEIVENLQRIPLYEETPPNDLSLRTLLKHESIPVRVAAAKTIVQAKRSELFDDIVQLARDDALFVAKSTIVVLANTSDENRNRRLIRAASFPEWQNHHYYGGYGPTHYQPFKDVISAVGLPPHYQANSHWQWNELIESLKAKQRAGEKIQRERSRSLFASPYTLNDRPWIKSLDKSVANAGDQLRMKVRVPKSTYHTATPQLEIKRFHGSIENGSLTSTTTKIKSADSREVGDQVETEFVISLGHACRPGDYAVCRRYDRSGRTLCCLRVLRSQAQQNQIPTLTGENIDDLREAARLRSPLSAKQIKARLDNFPTNERGNGHKQDKVFAYHYWRFLAELGTEEAARALLNEEPYSDLCVEHRPDVHLLALGSTARKPSLEILRNWNEHDPQKVNLAMSGLGPTGTADELPLCKQIIAAQRLRLRTLATNDAELVAKHKKPDELRKAGYFELIHEQSDRKALLIRLLSTFPNEEREYTLATIRDLLDNKLIGGLDVTYAFQKTDPEWAAPRLLKLAESCPNGENLRRMVQRKMQREWRNYAEPRQPVPPPTPNDSAKMAE